MNPKAPFGALKNFEKIKYHCRALPKNKSVASVVLSIQIICVKFFIYYLNMYLLNNHTWFFNFSNFLNGPKRALHPKCPFEPLKNL
ncbi:MAG: hypothetical protein AVDCRST_MAG96-1203 [uncultured Segetibacter sp.]|uniref:Uncharacterized protein n=1 Tax=uncultured Segetibacter sp. TaxID=481133 RepID=A0A6J4RXT9_9BACT|nr:MAG: hypothetical protein AVDCRST_MAG96-1203 [uncultured Segetibacter sp.]